jgi:uroporphyrinogen decarboxylase
VDWRIGLDDAWERLGDDLAIQGNLDPAVLFAPVAEIERRAADILNQAAGRPGHIFNLGHGILTETPVEHVRRLAEFVHESSKTPARPAHTPDRHEAQGSRASVSHLAPYAST